MDSATRAQELLEQAFGDRAEFRDDQLDAILALVDDRARVLLVQRTGWGKSVVYFLATALLRRQGGGPTILISPLLALMRDQVRMADRLGVRADTMNSQNQDRWSEIEDALQADEVDVLLVSPERLANEHFRTKTLASIPRELGLLVVDEAHCISDWGHDFRPDYRRIRSLVQGLPRTVPLLATTATANNRVIADVTEQLGSDLQVIRGPLGRESLHLQVLQLPSQADRLAWLARYVPSVKGSGIIYVLTHADARLVSSWLMHRGIDAPAYRGGDMSHEERQELEQRLLDDDVKALVATVALGMGFDKPDLGFVVHFQRPGSPIAYYQQIGRAGRALDRAEVVLLAGEEDDAIADYFIGNAFPPEQELRDVLSALENVEDASESDLQRLVNLNMAAISRALKILEVDGAISRDGSRYARTPTRWSLDSERVAAVTATRIRERERMAELVQTGGCLMAFVRAELDDPVAEPCGRCANCAGPFAPTDVEQADVEDAVRFLRRIHRPILPRKQWPARFGDRPRNIPAEHQLIEGRALSVYGDAGWGQLVKAGKYGGSGFDDRLVEAVAEMLENDWQPDVTPTWVTAVPSRRAPDLVPGFAKRLADRLGLPYRDALEKIGDTPPQKTMENSYYQAQNALESFAVIAGAAIAEPVFLVDDMVDSRWSITVCGVLLAEAGCGPVVPLALAETTKGAQQ
ncbi:MAG TPA: RecQ family ATP-dependent DNA helicase [Solirubrobacteraceae bacterium]